MKEEIETFQWVVNYIMSKLHIIAQIPIIVFGFPILSWYFVKRYYKGSIEEQKNVIQAKNELNVTYQERIKLLLQNSESLKPSNEEIKVFDERLKNLKSKPNKGDLNGHIAILSVKISRFITDRMLNQPQVSEFRLEQGFEIKNWTEQMNNLAKYHDETCSLFSKIFGKQLTEIFDELIKKGYESEKIDYLLNRSRKPYDIRIIAAKLGALAEKLS